MKLSCLPVSWFSDILAGKKSPKEWIRFAASLDLDGVDFSILFFRNVDEGGVYDLREEIHRLGLQACMLATYPDFTHPSPAERNRQVEDMRNNIRLASQLGASLIRVTAGQRHPDVSRQQGVKWAADGLRQVVAEADQRNVRLAYENHTKGAPWQYWDFSQSSDIYLEILDALRDTSLGVNFDTANPLVSDEDPLILLEKVKDRVISVHAFDVRAPGVLEPVVVGAGVAPFPEIFSVLKSTGFDGWICIEEASRTGTDGFERAVAYVRRAWEEA
jgi:sugar phosphate isomerase/epimerase